MYENGPLCPTSLSDYFAFAKMRYISISYERSITPKQLAEVLNSPRHVASTSQLLLLHQWNRGMPVPGKHSRRDPRPTSTSQEHQCSPLPRVRDRGQGRG